MSSVDVSQVDGFNLPIVVTPAARPNGSSCAVAGCYDDVRRDWPFELAVNVSMPVCSGPASTAAAVTCQPTFYSKIFKMAWACPCAYGTNPPASSPVQSPDYSIIFCSNRSLVFQPYRLVSLTPIGS